MMDVCPKVSSRSQQCDPRAELFIVFVSSIFITVMIVTQRGRCSVDNESVPGAASEPEGPLCPNKFPLNPSILQQPTGLLILLEGFVNVLRQVDRSAPEQSALTGTQFQFNM